MRIARYYGAPRCDLVIEPFAGSAAYSVYWGASKVKLYDIDESICALWDWLIHCSSEDILQLPDVIEDDDHLNSIPNPAQQLIRRWFQPIANVNRKMPFSNYHRKRLGTHENPTHYRPNPCIWSRMIKRRLVKQKPMIANWSISQLDYVNIPNENAHWHIDPPYNSKAGKGYVHGADSIDYNILGDWCKERSGEVDVCEKDNADWLPFLPLRRTVNYSGRTYTELLWRKNFVEPQSELFNDYG